MIIIRWIPLLIILTVAFFALIYIIEKITEFNKKHFYFASLLYLTLLATILFTPFSFDGTAVYLMPAGIGQVNLHHIYYDLGFVENIILTIPLGFLIKEEIPQTSILSMAPLGIIIGGSIETTQYILSHLFLINRTTDISDVVSNAIGIVIGGILLVVYQYLFERKSLSIKKS